MRIPSVALLLGSLAGQSGAAPAPAGDELPIVLTPSRMAQNISESPSAVTVIDRDTILATGARKTLDVLRLVPGFSVGSAYGNLQTGTYHGLADDFARRIQVLVDGRSTWLPAFGGLFWLNLPVPIEDIDRIEVIRGPNAASYGSSAFLATINIFTRHASETVGTRAALTTGSNAVQDQYLHHGGQRSDLAYSFSISRQRDSGYDALTDTRRDDMVLMRADYTLSAHDELTAQVGVSDSTYEAGTGDAFNPYRHIGQQDNFQYLGWTRALGEGDELRVTLARNHFNNEHRHTVGPIDSPPLGTLVFDYGYEVTRYDLDLQHTLGLTDALRTVWGASLRRDELRSAAYLDTGETLTNDLGRVFGNIEYRLTPRTLFNAGAMVEASQYVGPEISPRAALIHHLAEGHTLRVAVNTGTRLPTMLEEEARHRFVNETGTVKIYKIVAAGGLESEHIVSRELGYLYRPHAGMSLDLRLYHDRISDLITPYYRPTGDGIGYYGGARTHVLDFYNHNAITAKGFEAQSNLRLGARDRLLLAYAYTQLDDNGTTGGYARTAPAHQVSGIWTHRFANGIEGSITYLWQDEMTWLDEEPIPSYDRLDVRLARPLGRHLRLELIGQNLSGAYADYRDDAAWDQTVYGRIVAEF